MQTQLTFIVLYHLPFHRFSVATGTGSQSSRDLAVSRCDKSDCLLGNEASNPVRCHGQAGNMRDSSASLGSCRQKVESLDTTFASRRLADRMGVGKRWRLVPGQVFAAPLLADGSLDRDREPDDSDPEDLRADVDDVGLVVAFQITQQTIVSVVVIGFFAVLGVAYFYKLCAQALVFRCKCALCSGAYRLREELSEGGYGAVFSAYQLALSAMPNRAGDIHHRRLGRDGKKRKRLVVIKKILVDDITEAAAYSAEAQKLRSLKHPNVITYIDEFIHQETALSRFHLEKQTFFMIVTEMCRRGDLYSVALGLREAGTLTFDQVMKWFRDTVRAVDWIHERNILHRDIKAQNVFLCEDGSLRLGDFGLCCEDVAKARRRGVTSRNSRPERTSSIKCARCGVRRRLCPCSPIVGRNALSLRRWASRAESGRRSRGGESRQRLRTRSDADGGGARDKTLYVTEDEFDSTYHDRADAVELDWDYTPNVPVGTDCYLAPEVALGGENGKPADIWGLGCLLLELLSGVPLWHLSNRPYDVVIDDGRGGVSNLVDSLLRVDGAITPAPRMVQLLKKMLQRDPGARPSASRILHTRLPRSPAKNVLRTQ